jgi:hypothetical protein
MTRKSFVDLLAIAARRRAVATALVYGLSLGIRFTSATGEEVEIPAQSLQRTNPATSIVTKDSAQPRYNSALLMLFRRGWPLRPSSTPSCPSP